MCDCSLLADAVFSPIDISCPKMKFIYLDKYGVEHVLIKEFPMHINITRADVWEQRDETGHIVSYQFNVYEK